MTLIDIARLSLQAEATRQEAAWVVKRWKEGTLNNVDIAFLEEILNGHIPNDILETTGEKNGEVSSTP